MSCFFVLSLYDLSNADVIVRVSAKCTLVTIQMSDMKKILFGVMAIVGLCLSTVTLQSCDDGETYAEMKDKEKNAISHRGKAVREIAKMIGEIKE